MWIWTRIKNIGGNPDEEADLREEYGGEDPGRADEEYLGGAGFGAGLAVGDAAEVGPQRPFGPRSQVDVGHRLVPADSSARP